MKKQTKEDKLCNFGKYIFDNAVEYGKAQALKQVLEIIDKRINYFDRQVRCEEPEIDMIIRQLEELKAQIEKL